MSQQPDDRTWEEEHIHHLNVEIEVLKTNAKVIELAVADICLELEEHGYGDSNNLRAYSELMRGLNNPHNKHT